MNQPTKSVLFVAVALTVALSACGAGQAAGASTTGSRAGTSQAGDQWNTVVAAGQHEAQVKVLSQAGTNVGEALTAGFKQRYPEIAVDLNGVGSGAMEAKVLTERNAGQFTYDVTVHGPPDLLNLMEAQALDPLQPYLGGPNTQDPSKWLGGGFDYADSAGKFIFMFTSGASTPLIYDPRQVAATDFSSWRDLLSPKWKGKIAMYDPRIPGNAQGLAQFWENTSSLGRDFIKDLFAQQIVFTKEDRQLADWIGQGRYALGLGTNAYGALELKQKGVPIEFLSSERLKEGIYLTASWCSVAVFNRAPHPNAARLYMDWLLGKQAQDAISKAAGFPSRRQDASTEGLLQDTLPKPGTQYLELSKEQYWHSRPQLVEYLKSVISE